MDPKIFGRGSWIFIFQTLFFFYYKIIEEILFLKSIKELNKKQIINNKKEIEQKLKIYFPNNSLSKIKFILYNDLQTLINIQNEIIIEDFKKKIIIIINGLPCEECKNHSLRYMKKNNFINSKTFFFIFNFFLELRNLFYTNKIDRRLFNSFSDIKKNESLLFNKLINTNS